MNFEELCKTANTLANEIVKSADAKVPKFSAELSIILPGAGKKVGENSMDEKFMQRAASGEIFTDNFLEDYFKS